MKYRVVAGLPGVPYSSFEVTFDPEEAPDVTEIAQYAAAWAAAFRDAGLGGQNSPPERQVDSAPPRQAAPAQRQQSASNGRSQPARKGTGLFCPDHEGIQLIESARQYQEWDEGPNGEQVPAKFFCPGRENGTGANHTVWRSKAVPA